MPVLRLRFFSERENMNFRTEKISVSGNYGNCPVIDPENPSFSWACTHDGADQYQTAFRVTVSSGGDVIHDSGWQTGRKQRYTLPVPLPEARLLSVKIVCRDRDGRKCAGGREKGVSDPVPADRRNLNAPFGTLRHRGGGHLRRKNNHRRLRNESI